MKRISFVFVLVLMALTSGCLLTGNEKNTTTTQYESTTTSTELTTTITEPTTTTTEPTTTTTIEQIDITTTTTSTTTTIIYRPTTTIANARCYMNSDCGSSSLNYYCKRRIDETQPQPTPGNMAVYQVKYTYICIYPGTAYAECKIHRTETIWDECTEGEECIEGCYKCLPVGERKCK